MRCLSCLLLLLVVGCHSTPKENIPTQPLMSIEDSRDVLARRARATHNVSAEGTVTLINAKGDDVRLDAAVVLELPERARIRAYKLGSAVFDLTMSRGFVYLYAPRGEGKTDIEQAGSNAGEMAHWWLRQMSVFFDRPDLKWTEKSDVLIATGTDQQGRTITATVDRRYLVAREFAIPDSKGTVFTMKLGGYQLFNNTLGFEKDWPKAGKITPDAIPPQDIAWPTHIEAKSPRGSIIIDLRDVLLNTELPAGAFDPPARATRLP